MANKKSTSNGRSRAPIFSNNDPKSSIDRNENDSLLQVENLKSLNMKVLLETTDLRERVNYLQKENMALESHLEKSDSRMADLQRELSLTTEELLCLELQKDLNGVFLASQAYSFEDNLRGFVEGREARSKHLEREFSGICRERDDIEWEKKKRELEIKVLKDRSEELMAALEREGELLSKLNQETYGLRFDLFSKIEETKSLGQEILDLHRRISEYENDLRLLDLEKNRAIKISESEKINALELKSRVSELEDKLSEAEHDLKVQLQSKDHLFASRVAEMESIIEGSDKDLKKMIQKVGFLEMDLAKRNKLLWTAASVLAAIAFVGFWTKGRHHV